MTDAGTTLDFVYVGGPRCGSTWLSAILSDHPNVFVPPSKEIHFFNDRMPYSFEYRYPKGIDYYLNFFTHAGAEQICGDISPFYFLDPNAAWRIHRHFPNVKIIVSLRDPVDMIYSLYLLLRQRERRADTFEAELDAHPQLIDLGRYDRLLQPYFDFFPSERILVLLHDDIKEDALGTARRAFAFIGVDETFHPPSLERKFNLAGDKPPKRLKQARGHLIRALNFPLLRPLKQAMLLSGMKDIRYYGMQEKPADTAYEGPAQATRISLASMLKPDLDRLAVRLDRDLSLWPTCQA